MLLILAGVSISLILDNNGIIKKSKDARREYRQAQANEQADLSDLSDLIDDATAEPTPKVNVNTKAEDNSTINGKKGNSNNPTVPKGYIPINTETSSWGDGTSAPTQDSVDHGLVIKGDSDDNEWVWIPVDETTLATMCNTSNETEYTLCGTSGETAVKTKLYSSTITIGKDSNTITRTTPGTTSDYREPDLVVGSNGTSYDAKEEYYKDILGFSSKEKMAEAFVADYNEMIVSIGKYGGFYIGRYELSESGVKKDQPTLTKTNWYDLYQKCKILNASNKVEARMIWGCQWDATMNWLISSGAKTSDEVNKDSSTWGNYKNYNTANNYTEGTAGYEKNAGSPQNTGSSENWKANNIYDLAGNVWEWTQEANNTGGRIQRGGGYSSNGSFGSASNLLDGNSDYDIFSALRFSSHFNNKVTLDSRA